MDPDLGSLQKHRNTNKPRKTCLDIEFEINTTLGFLYITWLLQS